MRNEQRIFIQISAYRDPELLPTMRDAVEKADRPQNLRFGICFQGEKSCPDYEALLRFSGCRVAQVDPGEAKGICEARFAIQQLWQGEEYTLQIHSHMRFVPGWDTLLLEMCAPLGEKAILTCYCAGYEPDQPLAPNPPAHTLAADGVGHFGRLSLTRRVQLSPDGPPVPGAFWSGHFSFSAGQIMRDLPDDPSRSLRGDETAYAVRAWTHGYRFFYPRRTICYHCYTRVPPVARPREGQNRSPQEVLLQVRRLLGIETSTSDAFASCGLGTVRSPAEYEAFSGVDFKARTLRARAWNGLYGDFPALCSKRSADAFADQRVLLVTAFHEIGRGEWGAFRRGRELYLDWFSHLAALKNLRLACYCEQELRRELPAGEYEIRDLQLEDTFFSRYFEAEKEIMQRPAFREFIKERIAHPEHSYPEYSMTTHAKVNFVRRAATQFPGYSHYIWIDFGAVRMPLHPDTVFDWSWLMDDKVHMQVFMQPKDCPTDAGQLCRESPDALSASLFVIPAEKIRWYEDTYEQELRRNHAVGIADDEQNIMLRMAQKYPDQITADPVEGWQGFFYTSIV